MSDDLTVPVTESPGRPRRAFAPSLPIGKWAAGLGIATGVWGLLFPFVGQILRGLVASAPSLRIPVGLGGAVVEVMLAISALVTGAMALRRGERSWLVLIAFALAVAIGGFWVVFAVGEVLVPH